MNRIHLSLKQVSIALIMLMLAALIADNLFSAFLMMTDKHDTETGLTHQQQPLASNALSKSKQITPQAIIGWHLFGKSEAVQATNVPAPETSLKLKLIGVISSDDMQQARAIIAVTSDKQKHYKVRDTINDNVKIKAIYADRIILIHNSRDEVLFLERKKLDKLVAK
jgi:general secretion pathway protein C